MIDACVAHEEERVKDGGARRMLIVVPPGLPSRVEYFTRLLEGSGIEIVVDRRVVERRLNSGRRSDERRRQDRRAPQRVFGYFQGCSIVVRVRSRAASPSEANHP